MDLEWPEDSVAPPVIKEEKADTPNPEERLFVLGVFITIINTIGALYVSDGQGAQHSVMGVVFMCLAALPTCLYILWVMGNFVWAMCMIMLNKPLP